MPPAGVVFVTSVTSVTSVVSTGSVSFHGASMSAPGIY